MAEFSQLNVNRVLIIKITHHLNLGIDKIARFVCLLLLLTRFFVDTDIFFSPSEG